VGGVWSLVGESVSLLVGSFVGDFVPRVGCKVGVLVGLRVVGARVA
jgi:hypothetical protein